MTGAHPAALPRDEPVTLAAGLVRVTADNPGVMTGPGTNTYLVGTEAVAVIDPGPDDPAHLAAVLGAAPGPIRWILVTHTHPDHAPGAAALARATGALRMGYASRDRFAAERTLVDGSRVDVPGAPVTAVHTPGHASNHLCYLVDLGPGVSPRRVLVTGDHVMEGSTVVINPPDGDLDAYLASLERVLDLDPPPEVLAPGHGALITDPAGAVRDVLAHRRARAAKVRSVLDRHPGATVGQLVPEAYDDVDAERHPIAARSLWAHLRSLARAGQARSSDPDDPDGVWWATPENTKG
ncbi:MAG: MBL fold metallo-hydrolase [Actinomycetota bacterium]|nr:MBL fold metallo-hydrolase [Actinomycetota bacterium]